MSLWGPFPSPAMPFPALPENFTLPPPAPKIIGTCLSCRCEPYCARLADRILGMQRRCEHYVRP